MEETTLLSNPLDLADFDLDENPRRRRRRRSRRRASARRAAPRRRRRSRRRVASNPFAPFSMNPRRRRRGRRRAGGFARRRRSGIRRNPAFLGKLFGGNSALSRGGTMAIGGLLGDAAVRVVNRFGLSRFIPETLAPYATGLTKIAVGYFGEPLLRRTPLRRFASAFGEFNVAVGFLTLADPIIRRGYEAVGLADYETVGDTPPGLMSDYDTVGDFVQPSGVMGGDGDPNDRFE